MHLWPQYRLHANIADARQLASRFLEEQGWTVSNEHDETRLRATTKPATSFAPQSLDWRFHEHGNTTTVTFRFHLSTLRLTIISVFIIGAFTELLIAALGPPKLAHLFGACIAALIACGILGQWVMERTVLNLITGLCDVAYPSTGAGERISGGFAATASPRWFLAHAGILATMGLALVATDDGALVRTTSLYSAVLFGLGLLGVIVLVARGKTRLEPIMPSVFAALALCGYCAWPSLDVAVFAHDYGRIDRGRLVILIALLC